MQLKPILAICFATLTCWALGQQHSVSVVFHDGGNRDVWIGTGLPDALPAPSALAVHDAIVNLPIGDAKPTDAIFVWDHKTGNLASKTVKDVVSQGTWTVEPQDNHDIAEVKVKLVQNNAPVQAAIVTLQDGRRTQQQLVDASSNGEATFYALKPGTLKAVVQYKSKGRAAKPVNQEIEAPITRTDPIPVLTIALAEPTDTGAPTATSAAGQPGSSAAGTPQTPAEAAPASGVKSGGAASGGAQKPEGSNPVGSIFAYVLGLLVAAGLIAAAVFYFKGNGQTVASKLEQLGVQIPKPGDQGLTDPASLAAPVPAPKPTPPQKIILDDAAPTPISQSPAAPIPMPSAPLRGEPQLVSNTGDAVPLPQGETIVGRDAGLGISLVGESTISRRHAQMVRSGNEVRLSDLGSTNGTFVNGAKLTQETTLRPGDQVQFGAVQFRFEA